MKKYNLLKYLPLLMIPFMIFTGCKKDSSSGSSSILPEREFKVVSFLETYTPEGYPSVMFAVRNKGTKSFDNIRVKIMATKNNGEVLDSDIIEANNGETILPGKTVSEVAEFKNLSSHDDYQKLDYTFLD